MTEEGDDNVVGACIMVVQVTFIIAGAINKYAVITTYRAEVFRSFGIIAII